MKWWVATWLTVMLAASFGACASIRRPRLMAVCVLAVFVGFLGLEYCLLTVGP